MIHIPLLRLHVPFPNYIEYIFKIIVLKVLLPPFL